jgi:hypothetical protein
MHIGYTLAVSGAASPLSGSPSALMGYTTSQPWPHAPLPLGVFAFDQEIAASFGQSRAFVMDLRRIAFMPVTPTWFPQLNQPSHGIQGHAPKRQQRRFRQMAADLLQHHSEIVDRLGPLWPA